MKTRTISPVPTALVLYGLSFFCLEEVNGGLIPATPQEQTRRAIDSIRKAITSSSNDEQRRNRLYVDYLIPLPPETTDADIDPWPGGLKQQYPYAKDILEDILKGIVQDPADTCQSQVIDDSDCCGFFVQESKFDDAKQDVAAILFPGVDQLDQIQEIDTMVGPERTLILFNKQFQRPQDFGFGQRERSEKIVFEPYTWGFAFQELVCRGEDVKLMYETPYWTSSVICDEDVDLGRRELELLLPQEMRPTYKELEEKIGEVLPEPLWMRKMGEAETKGFKFQRGRGGQTD